MLDQDLLAMLIFTVVLATIVGGFILLYPLSRRVGRLLDDKAARDQKQRERPTIEEIHALREQLQTLESEVRALTERQVFMEQLLQRREVDALPRGQHMGV